MFEFLTDLFTTPVHVRDATQLRPGRVVVTGKVRADGDLVVSPVRAVTCVAFAYRSTWLAPNRGRNVQRPLRTAMVFAPRFVLEIEGGEVQVEGGTRDAFGPEDHRAAQHAGLYGFKATEQVVRPGDRIRLHGRARRDGERWVVAPEALELVDVKPLKSRRQRRRR